MAIAVRAMFYMLLVGGGWLVALPALILRVEKQHIIVLLRPAPELYLGAALFLVGTQLAVLAGYYLITRGQGTPLPLDPPSQLVTSGPYRFVRNPQAIAMTLMVAGEIVAISSRALWILLPLTLVYLEWIVGPWEEKGLEAKYGERYQTYKRGVRKWIPLIRLRARLETEDD